MNPLGSVLSYQLSPVEFNFQVYIDTSAVGSNSFGDKHDTINLPDLPIKLCACDSNLSKWILSDKGERKIKHLQVTLPEAIAIEKVTTEQRNCKEWFRAGEKRITASAVHRISVQKRQFENLASELAKLQRKQWQMKIFFVELVNGKSVLKSSHPLGYYDQIQFQLGLAQLKWCDFVVYMFHGLTVTRIPFDEDHFVTILAKVNDFYFRYYLKTLFTDV